MPPPYASGSAPTSRCSTRCAGTKASRSTDHSADVRSIRLLRTGRWVNREPGAAARACLDRLLDSLPRPAGYQRVVRSHQGVAATVSSGWAEAGMCVRQVAADAGLSFLSVQQADYELCIPDHLIGDPVVAALVHAVRSPRYRRWLAAVPGCSTSRTGELRGVGPGPRQESRRRRASKD